MKMSILTLLGVLLASIGFAEDNADVYSFGSIWNGIRSEIRITQQDIDKSPAWSANEANAPLPPRRALALCEAALPPRPEKASAWELDVIQLRPIKGDKWIYIVEFKRNVPREEASDGYRHIRMALAVTMAGEVIQPKAKKP